MVLDADDADPAVFQRGRGAGLPSEALMLQRRRWGHTRDVVVIGLVIGIAILSVVIKVLVG